MDTEEQDKANARIDMICRAERKLKWLLFLPLPQASCVMFLHAI